MKAKPGDLRALADPLQPFLEGFILWTWKEWYAASELPEVSWLSPLVGTWHLTKRGDAFSVNLK